MKKKLISTILIFICIFAAGCGSNNTAKSNANTKSSTADVNSSSSSSDQNTVDTGSGTDKNVSNVDYSKYTGNWDTEENIKKNYKYGTSMGIKVDKDGNISGQISTLSDNATHIANVDFNGKIQNNKFDYSFKEDGWEHSGTIHFDFQGDSITAVIKITSQKNGSLWSIQEGTFKFQKVASASAQTIDELKSEGAKIIDKQSFPVKLENFGNVKFVAVSKPVNDYNKAYFYLADSNGNILYTFPDFYGNKWSMLSSIDAVSFTDVNGDGLKDIVIVSKYVTGAGSDGSTPFNVSGVYFQKGKEFTSNSSLDEKLNDADKNTDVKTVISYAKNYLKK